jgi:hypothetical protein
LFSITISTGPIGGDPVPLIRVAPLMIIRLKGPLPSDRSAPGIKLFSTDCEKRLERAKKMKNIVLKRYFIASNLQNKLKFIAMVH